ncbi:4-hydroxy-tetrahydrodipicolinate synthase [Thalassotalea euphylliae]|uniref:4-hydroxy-tetrahydrodipicolinate synthase n=1 Tax=Thalassotalea euphylliae TaxID=1655234 RepID=UPI0036387664
MNLDTSYNLAEFPLWTALVTPFTDGGSVDFASLSRIARQQAAAGNALLVLGSTGEALSLTAEQQFAVVNYICELHLDVPIMVGVGGNQLNQQLAWIEKCNALAVDAFLLGAPLYAKPGPEGQHLWFSALLDAADKPCMLYNVPSRSGVSLSEKTLAALQTHPNFWALKEASGDINQFVAYRQACPNIALYSGEDALLPYLATAGAQGLVSVAANAWPEATLLYARQCLSSQSELTFPTWHQAVEALFSVANPVPVKVLMHENGDIDSPQLQPPLTHLELGSKQALLKAHDAITDWYQLHAEQPKQRA